MAHLSGYDGTIAFGSSASDTVFEPDQTNSVKLQSWVVRQRTDTFRVKAKGDIVYKKFATVSGWSAECVFLIQDGLVATELDIKVVTGAKIATAVVFTTATNDTYTGTGITSSIDIDDPLDGPAVVTVGITGNGELVQAGA